MKVKAKQTKKAITVIHDYKPYHLLGTNICISKQTLISEITRQFAFTQMQKNSNYFNRSNIGNSALALFGILVDGEMEAEKIDGACKEVN